MSDLERYRAGQTVTWTSIAVNTCLSVLQILVGYFGRSQALLTDGLHTFSDLLSDFLVLFAGRQAAVQADEAHPYGHRRIETAATLFLGTALLALGVAILWNAGMRLQSTKVFPAVHVATLWIALGTLAAKEALYRYMVAVARRVRSQMLAANAWHTRADAATSLVGALGIAGNLMGFTFLDSLAAALVAFMIARMGWKLAHQALSELIDTAVDEKEVGAIHATLLATPGVTGLHELRTRRMAGQALVDAHVLVGPRISVSEGHFIAELARSRVLAAHDVLDVLVHVDPEDDAMAKPSCHLPPREALLLELQERLQIRLPPSAHIVLHYLDGKAEADVFLPLHPKAEQLRLAQAAQAAIGAQNLFRAIRLHYDAP